MNKKYINNLSKYLETVILPNLISYNIAYKYYHKEKYNKSFLKEFNNIRLLINIRNVNYIKVKKITNNILKTKYNLIIIKYYPLIVNKIT